MKEQFIAYATPRFIKTLRPFLDIEKNKDPEAIKSSGKSFIAWHPTGKEHQGELWEYFKKNNLPAYFVERGALPNTVVIDPNGFLCDSSSYDRIHWDRPLSKSEAKILPYVNDLITTTTSLEYQKGKKLMTRHRFFRELRLPDTEIIFVPLQLEGDTVIKRWSRWTGSVNAFYKTVQELARKYPNKTFLVKPHPLSNLKVQTEDNIINVDKYHYKNCLAHCDKVLTINSGVGLQAMAWPKPTILCGKAHYQFDGLNYDGNSLEKVNELLNEDLTVDYEKALRFLYFLKFRLYSDCIQVKKPASRTINRTDEVKYTEVRIFKG